MKKRKLKNIVIGVRIDSDLYRGIKLYDIDIPTVVRGALDKQVWDAKYYQESQKKELKCRTRT